MSLTIRGPGMTEGRIGVDAGYRLLRAFCRTPVGQTGLGHGLRVKSVVSVSGFCITTSEIFRISGYCRQ